MILLLFILFIVSHNYSQSNEYDIGNDEIKMEVHLFGQIESPGRYFIPIEFGLLELMSNAGGPLKDADLNTLHIIRKNKLITVNITKYLKTGDMTLLPALYPFDTVVINRYRE